MQTISSLIYFFIHSSILKKLLNTYYLLNRDLSPDFTNMIETHSSSSRSSSFFLKKREKMFIKVYCTQENISV